MKDSPAVKELKALWEDGLDSEVHRSAIAFFLLILITLAANLLLPNLREWATDQILSIMTGKDLTTPSGNLSFVLLFVNNMQACIFTMLYGLLPFLRLPAMALGINAALIGVLGASSIAQGKSLLFLVSIVPHGLFELPALILAFAMGLYVCGQMTRRSKKDKSARSLLDCLALISRFLFLVLVPLLFVAALIEAWVTPMLMLLFQ